MYSRVQGPPARSIVAAFASALLASACGAIPGPVDGSSTSDLRASGEQRTVHGSRMLHFVDGNGHVTDVPDPIAPFSVGALVRDRGTQELTRIDAVVNGNQFTIPGVSSDPYQLVFQAPGAPNVTHDVTDERSISFDQFILGRSNLASPGPGTTLAVDVSGLDAWDPNVDDLQLTAPGAGVGFGSLVGAGFSPQTGDTSLVATVDHATFVNANGGGGLIDTSQGDRVFLAQLTGAPTSSDVPAFNRLTRAARVPSSIMANGATTPLPSMLEPVPQTSQFDLTLRRGKLDALRADVGAGAQIAFSFTGVDALPGGFAAE